MLRMTVRRGLTGADAAVVATMRARAAAAEATVPNAAGIASASPAGARIRGEWLLPAGEPRDRAILYLHGGAYVAGSAALDRALAASLARACGVPTFSPNYRLAPEHRFPAAIDDAVAAFDFMRERLPASGIAIVGSSAGGGLALAVAQLLRDRDGTGTALPAAVVAYSPWTDLFLTGTSVLASAKADTTLTSHALAACAAAYAGIVDRRDPRASPHYGSPLGLPPVLLAASEDELLRDDAVRFADRVRAAGGHIELELRPGLPHAWPVFASLPESRRTVGRTSRFLQNVWENTGASADAVKRRA